MIFLDINDLNESIRFLGIKVINSEDFTQLLIRFALNLLMILFIVYVVYAKNSQRKDFSFSYIAISVTIFTLCFLLESVKLELGFALGLFAIFGIIRYRTDAIPIKEMTYLFVVIGVSVINALSNKKVSYIELIFTNLAILSIMWILERYFLSKHEVCIEIEYEKIENIHIHNTEALYADIEKRTGIKVKRIEVTEINYLRDVANIKVYHEAKFGNGQINTF